MSSTGNLVFTLRVKFTILDKREDAQNERFK